MSAPRAHDRSAGKTGGGRGTGPVRWFLHGGWYVFAIVLSLGMLSFVPFLHVALRLRRPLAWLWVGLYTAAVVALFQVTGRTYAGGLIAGLMVIASVHAIVLRRSVWSPAAGPAHGTASATARSSSRADPGGRCTPRTTSQCAGPRVAGQKLNWSTLSAVNINGLS
jgi:hypothetical protein